MYVKLYIIISDKCLVLSISIFCPLGILFLILTVNYPVLCSTIMCCILLRVLSLMSVFWRIEVKVVAAFSLFIIVKKCQLRPTSGKKCPLWGATRNLFTQEIPQKLYSMASTSEILFSKTYVICFILDYSVSSSFLTIKVYYAVFSHSIQSIAQCLNAINKDYQITSLMTASVFDFN